MTRLVAFAADVGASWGLFTLALAGVTFAVHLVTGHDSSTSTADQLVALVVAWSSGSSSTSPTSGRSGGKTIGMALLGIRVVAPTVTPITARQAVIRTLTLPLSFLLFGLGFLGILLNKDRHALPRPAGQDGRRLLLGRPGRPAAVAGQAGADATPT